MFPNDISSSNKTTDPSHREAYIKKSHSSSRKVVTEKTLDSTKFTTAKQQKTSEKDPKPLEKLVLSSKEDSHDQSNEQKSKEQIDQIHFEVIPMKGEGELKLEPPYKVDVEEYPIKLGEMKSSTPRFEESSDPIPSIDEDEELNQHCQSKILLTISMEHSRCWKVLLPC